MKTLKMLTGLSGPEYCLAPGDEHEFPADEADRLIDAGAAEEVVDVVPLQKPVAEKPAAKKATAK